MVSRFHSPFCFTDIDLYKKVVTLTFQLYFKNRPKVSPIYQEGSQSIHSANLGAILVDLYRKSRKNPSQFIVQIQQGSQFIHTANLGGILADSQGKSRRNPGRFIAQIQEESWSIHCTNLGGIPVDLQRESRKDPS